SVTQRQGGPGRRLGAKVAGVLATALACAFTGAISADAAAAHVGPAKTATTIPATDWAAYLNGPLHSSYNASEKVITPASASQLKQKWKFTTGDGYLASPTVADGAVYIGAN